MDTKIFHDLIESRYPDPVCKIYEPSEYDVKRATTPKRKEKLNALIAKEQAKLDVVYQCEVNRKMRVHQIIDEISTYPERIALLFCQTFQWTINDIVRRHEAYLKQRKLMSGKYSEYVIEHCYAVKHVAYTKKYESTWSGRGRYVEHEVTPTQEEWDKFCEYYHNWNVDTKQFDYPFKEIKDWKQFITEYRKYKTLAEADEVHSLGDDAYVNSISHMADVLDRVCKDINKIFDGNKPTICESDPQWGVDGHFNGILSDGKTRASFKSFGAGGYNIQRFHYRFKITKLKN